MGQGRFKVTPNGDPFTDCLAATLNWEGDFFNHPRDPGGRTLQGVILERYHQYRRAEGLPVRDVLEMERDELFAIYKRYYWDVAGCGLLTPGADLVVFDFAVNSGPGRATPLAKKLADYVGTVFVDAYMDAREDFLRGLRTFDVFGKGWLNRTRDIRKVALARVEGVPLELKPLTLLPPAKAMTAEDYANLLD